MDSAVCDVSAGSGAEFVSFLPGHVLDPPAVPFGVPIEPPGVDPEQFVDTGTFSRFAWFLLGFALVLLVGWYVLAPLLSRTIRHRNRNNPTLQEAVTRYFRLLIFLVAIFVGLAVAGYSQLLTGSALVVAALTLAIGVAGQTIIGSLVSGLVLVFDPEFNIGNYIEWDDGAGTIESITLRVTRVETPDGGLVTIPNTVLTSQEVTRPFGRNRYRLVERVDIAYEADVEEALARLEAAASELDDVLTNPGPQAYVDELGDDAVVLRVHYWIRDPDPDAVTRIRSQYARALQASLEAADITISPASQRELQGRIEVGEEDTSPS